MSTPEETVILLLDSYWFNYNVFSAIPNPYPKLLQLEKPKLNRINTQMKKSMSDHFLSTKDFPDYSPNSVLTPHLKTILSGKETKDELPFQDPKPFTAVKFSPKTEKTKKKRGNSRSLSELEFEEVKGFMDLGFVFSNNEKDSKLVSIIPGLQRLGKNDVVEESCLEKSRPYLSEAWDCLEEKKKNSPLVDWRIPSFRNEMEMKKHLRFWAHTVASTVR